MTHYYGYTSADRIIPVPDETSIFDGPTGDRVQVVKNSQSNEGYFIWQEADFGSFIVQKKDSNGSWLMDGGIKQFVGSPIAGLDLQAAITISRDGQTINIISNSSIGNQLFLTRINTNLDLIETKTISSIGFLDLPYHFEDQHGNFYAVVGGNLIFITADFTTTEVITTDLPTAFTIVATSGSTRAEVLYSKLGSTDLLKYSYTGTWYLTAETGRFTDTDKPDEMIINGPDIFYVIDGGSIKRFGSNTISGAVNKQEYDVTALGFTNPSSLQLNKDGSIVGCMTKIVGAQNGYHLFNSSFTTIDTYFKNPDQSPIFVRSFTPGLDMEGWIHANIQGV